MTRSQELQSGFALQGVLAWLQIGLRVWVVNLLRNTNINTTDGIRHFDYAIEFDHRKIWNLQASELLNREQCAARAAVSDSCVELAERLRKVTRATGCARASRPRNHEVSRKANCGGVFAVFADVQQNHDIGEN